MNRYALKFRSGHDKEYVLLPELADLESGFTIEAWIKTSTEGAEGSIFSMNGALVESGNVDPYTSLIKAVNFGGSAISGFEAGDEPPLAIERLISNNGNIPAQVYQSWKSLKKEEFTGLTPKAPHRVKIHFVELFVEEKKRIFNIRINGKRILENYDICSKAGGKNIAIVESLDVYSDEDGKIVIEAEKVEYDAIASGMALYGLPKMAEVKSTVDSENRYLTCEFPGESRQLNAYKLAQEDWLHLALSFDGSGASLYFNGQLHDSIGVASDLSGPSSIIIGPFCGEIEEFCVWGRSLNRGEIQSNMHEAETSLDGQGLVCLLSINEGEGKDVKDLTSHGNDGVIFGRAEWILSDREIPQSAPPAERHPEQEKDIEGSREQELDRVPDIESDSYKNSGNDESQAGSQVTIPAPLPEESRTAERYALHFSGVPGSHVHLEEINGINSAFTFELWFRFSGTNLGQALVKAFSQGEFGPENTLSIAVSGERGSYYLSARIGRQSLTCPRIADDEWTHVALSYGEGCANLLINGENIDADPTKVGSIPVPTEFYVGSDQGGSLFTGEVEDFRVWNRSLTREEIQTNLNAELTAEEDGLICAFAKDQGDNEGALCGGVTWKPSEREIETFPSPIKEEVEQSDGAGNRTGDSDTEAPGAETGPPADMGKSDAAIPPGTDKAKSETENEAPELSGSDAVAAPEGDAAELEKKGQPPTENTPTDQNLPVESRDDPHRRRRTGQTVAAKFAAANPIEFALYNEQDERVLYITESDTRLQTLTVELTNQSPHPIRFHPQATDQEASRDVYHFQLRFRPGTLSESVKYNLRNSSEARLEALNQGWEMNFDPDASDAFDWISYLWVGQSERAKKLRKSIVEDGGDEVAAKHSDSTFGVDAVNGILKSQSALKIRIPKLSAGVGGGARGTRVHLAYRNLIFDYGEAPTPVPESSRNQYLNVVNHQGKEHIPLHVGFVGSSTILNDGSTKNELTLRIVNTSETDTIRFASEPPSRFTFSFDTADGDETKDWGLGSTGQLQAIDLGVFGDSWDCSRHTEGPLYWAQTCIDGIGLEPGQAFTVPISNIVSSAPSGYANLYLRYEDIPGYWDGQFTCLIEKAPLVYREGNVGIGTDSPDAKIHVIGETFLEGSLKLTGEIKSREVHIGPIRGEVRMYAGSLEFFDETGRGMPNTELFGWALCNSENDTADLRGRFVIGSGNGSGLTDRAEGVSGGSEAHTLQHSHLPPHTHDVAAKLTGGDHQHVYHSGHWGTGGIGNGDQDEGEMGRFAHNNNTEGSGGHSHILNTSTDVGPGSSSKINHMPPFCALAYIQFVGVDAQNRAIAAEKLREAQLIEVQTKNLLDRAKQYIIPSDAALSSVPFAGNAITIEMWLNYDSSQSTDYPFLISESHEKLEIRLAEPDKHIRFIPTIGVYIDTPADAFKAGEWLHVACMYDANSAMAKIYLNGTEVVNKHDHKYYKTLKQSSSPTLFIGRRFNSEQPLKGQIHDLRIWDRVRTQDEIEQFMNIALTTDKEEHLIACWPSSKA